MEILNDIKEQLAKYSDERAKAVEDKNFEKAALIRDTEIQFRNSISETLFPTNKEWGLKDFLAMAWSRITSYYHLGNICSERHLQAELFHILKSDEQFIKEYKIYVEPTLYTKQGDTDIDKIIPDMLITKGKKIVAYIELKYVPHGYIRATDDIRKFYDFNECKYAEIYLERNPVDGGWSEDLYTICSDIIFVYGFISNHESEAFILKQDIFYFENIFNSETVSKLNYVIMYGGVGAESPQFGYIGKIKNNPFSKHYNLL